jgi:hypothetical protein
LENKFLKLTHDAEVAEIQIASNSQIDRIKTGSFYTPSDVACFICNILLDDHSVKDRISALKFIERYNIIEPSAGAGIFLFSIIHCLQARGLHEEDLKKINLTAIDINNTGLMYTKKILSLNGVNLICHNKNFLDIDLFDIPKYHIYLGNPPFIKNKGDHNIYDNLFADFIDKIISNFGDESSLYFIVPLSITFSGRYRQLRQNIMDKNFHVKLLNYDNIPDTLFYFGKPGSDNTNTANSQRCSILVLNSSKKFHMLSTKLQSWRKIERNSIFRGCPEMLDITADVSAKNFIRPYSKNIIEYYRITGNKTLKDIFQLGNKDQIHVAKVARNFIGIRESADSGSMTFSFVSKNDFYKFLAIVTSDIFFQHWRTVGDGFHVTKNDIESFPIKAQISDEALSQAKKVWKQRYNFKKVKNMHGKIIETYDFSNIFANHEIFEKN